MGVTRMGKTTIFLADDDEGVRRTLRTFFEGLPGYRVVGEACDGMEAVEGCRASAPDVALLDIQMPLLDGVSVARQVLADRAAKCHYPDGVQRPGAHRARTGVRGGGVPHQAF